MDSSKGSLRQWILLLLSRQWILLLLSCAALCIGLTGGPVLLRFYFLHGGSRKWLSAWLQTGGWPIALLPIFLSSRFQQSSHVTPKLSLASVGLGVISGLVDFFYAWGVSYLPVSTSSLLLATQLAFNAVFAFFFVKQKFSPYSINALVLLTLGSGMLALHTSSDRPDGVSKGQYWVGFIVTLAAAALYGLLLPLIELVYKKSTRQVTYTLAMEMQLLMSITATAFCTVGMVVNKDFQAVGREARASDVGELKYYMALVCTAICFQLSFIGMFGVIFLTSSLFSGIFFAVFIPVTEVVAVIIYHEKFSGEKGMALFMSLWGFASYLYGEYKNSKSQTSNMPEDLPRGSESATRELLSESATP